MELKLSNLSPMVIILFTLSGAGFMISSDVAGGEQICLLEPDLENPGWQVLSCRQDVSVSPSEDAVFTTTDANEDGVVDTIDLEYGAIRTRLNPEVDPAHFQIRTRQAIVSVRGTDWATALSDVATEVFVISGEVQVTDLELTSGVVLTPGLGVDVPEARLREDLSAPTDESPSPGAGASESESDSDNDNGGSARSLIIAPSVPEPTSLRPVEWGASRVDSLLARFPGT